MPAPQFSPVVLWRSEFERWSFDGAWRLSIQDANGNACGLLSYIGDDGEWTTNDPIAKKRIRMTKDGRVRSRVKTSQRVSLLVCDSCRIYRQQHKKYRR